MPSMLLHPLKPYDMVLAARISLLKILENARLLQTRFKPAQSNDTAFKTDHW
ncbi:hypothetical protein PtA15_9A471 [Puccinia triticina]|uniref:Uncharacterized protein n=1 Tax=Puccinia triticina TaxID=208348 RepID=A0ABY7CUN8_9BASI|nr:uncharacterized protein PtA15_9A471 [Puccinia triticina]WAQ88344.1 hypothetical protein PtA15_9A471 [Puccinia triticina]WAR60523.1 hypothetical protein PtB15_9B462 [Puccinia triticina]